MGIDAQMLVRGVPQETVTDDWLTRMSWALVRSIGAGKFWISDGLPPDEFRKASKEWHAAFQAHPRYADFDTVKTPDERQAIHEAIRADIGQAPTELRRAIERTLTHYRDDDTPPAGSVYYQDGHDVLAAPGECLLELSLSGRYYGVGYERGDLLAYCAIAEWLEVNIPGCAVHYGGDSSGVCAEPFDAAAREKLKRHLYSQAGRDYFNYRMPFMAGDVEKRPPPCGLCPGGTYHGNQHGWGQNYAAYSCAGCGKRAVTRDGGKTWQQPTEND